MRCTRPARARRAIATVVLAVALGAPDRAHAACNFSITPLFNFGQIDLTRNITYTIAGTFTATCTNLLLYPVRVCPSFGAGTGGVAAGGNPRYLLSGGNQLTYNIYSDAGYTTI